jgi:hypothetical protein
MMAKTIFNLPDNSIYKETAKDVEKNEEKLAHHRAEADVGQHHVSCIDKCTVVTGYDFLIMYRTVD